MSDERHFEYRACVGDKDRPGVFDEESEPVTDEREARVELDRMLSAEYTRPPYDVGWIERRVAPTSWERLP